MPDRLLAILGAEEDYAAPMAPFLETGISREDTFAFGSFRLWPARRLLTQEGAQVAIGGRALDILLTLAEHAPQVVSKRMLFDRVWPGMMVDESNLRFQMRGLRKALGGERYISTVSGRGYCLVAPFTRSFEAPRRAVTWKRAATIGEAAGPVRRE